MVRKYLFVLSVCSNLFFGFSFSLISKTEQNLHTPMFQKKLLHDPLLLSCFTLNPFLFHFLFFKLFFELLCKNLLLLFVHLLFLFSCVSLFFCLFSRLFSFFCCLHTVCEHRFFRIAFFQVCLFLFFFGSLF